MDIDARRGAMVGGDASGARRASQVRGTQSLVHTLGYCWSRPSLLAIELAWRWLFGAPALLLLYREAARIVNSVPLAATGIYDFNLTDPLRAIAIVSDAVGLLLPPALATAEWLAPLLLVGWAVASGMGRNLLLRRYDPTLPFRPRPLVLLQLLRSLTLCAAWVGWFLSAQWAARAALGSGDAAADATAEPDLVLYFALLICISLGMFTLWALASWAFSAAPLLALAEGRGAAAAMRQSVKLGPLTPKLVEVNMVLAIVKLALIVLAMVFSATPLPFESVAGALLYAWWAVVALLYFAASDFFQVARLVAFLELREAVLARR